MPIYRIETTENQTIDVDAENEAEAKKAAQVMIDDENSRATGKLGAVTELAEPKADSTTVQEDGGYTFTAWGIHVAAKSVPDAKRVIKEIYDVDVDKDTPPPAHLVAGKQ